MGEKVASAYETSKCNRRYDWNAAAIVKALHVNNLQFVSMKCILASPSHLRVHSLSGGSPTALKYPAKHGHLDSPCCVLLLLAGQGRQVRFTDRYVPASQPLVQRGWGSVGEGGGDVEGEGEGRGRKERGVNGWRDGQTRDTNVPTHE